MGKRTTSAGLLCVFLIVLSVSLFSMWGFQAVNYLLSTTFNVQTDSTVYDLFTGVIGMVASILTFVGAVLIWKMRKSSRPFILWGSLAFALKWVLEIFNVIYLLSLKSGVTVDDISGAASSIGWYLFWVAFSIFIAIFFTRKSFSKLLS